MGFIRYKLFQKNYSSDSSSSSNRYSENSKYSSDSSHYGQAPGTVNKGDFD